MNKFSVWFPASQIVAASLLFLNGGCRQATVGNSAADQSATACQIVVKMSVDYQGRHDNDSYDLQLPENPTAFEALKVAMATSEFDFSFSGNERTAFIMSINGVVNEGAKGSNWFYYVNEVLSDKGCGATRLSNGDKVLWKFR